VKNNNLGKIIENYQRKKLEYGDTLLKMTETASELKIEPVSWSNTVVDPSDIGCGMKIEKNDLPFLKLKKQTDVWDSEKITEAIAAAKKVG
jgi:hypothetical protein